MKQQRAAKTKRTTPKPETRALSFVSQRTDKPICELCNGTGVEAVPGKGARSCSACTLPAQERSRSLLLSKIPRRYSGARLDTLEANGLHKDQKRLVSFVKTHPFENYYLCGDNDTGKTHILWALYANAVTSGRNVIVTKLVDWIESLKAEFSRSTPERAVERYARIADLRQSRYPFSIFLDDIDKARPTEYVAEVFFNLIDTIYNYQHQLVVTSQLDPEKSVKGRNSLIQHFEGRGETYDGRYAIGIVRRIVNDETNVFKMF
jgi:DNA replication protein DnaC